MSVIQIEDADPQTIIALWLSEQLPEKRWLELLESIPALAKAWAERNAAS